MIANFHIHYSTAEGEHIDIQLRRNGAEETIRCQSYDAANWHVSLQVAENEKVAYKYLLQNPDGAVPEHGEFRTLFLPKGQSQVYCQDYWRPSHEEARAYFSAAFKDVVFRRENAPAKGRKAAKTTGRAANRAIIQLYAAAIPQHLRFCVLGNTPALGNWKKPVLLSDENFPAWQAEIEVDGMELGFEYKFAVCDPATGRIVEWEDGENRRLHFVFPSENGNALVRTDESYRYASARWRGAGMAVPVFSLRSEQGLGIGEFTDLKLLVDWASQTGMKLVQVLPVNDTIATKTWTDSYPYAAISVFALHPLYVNVQAVAKLKDKKAEARLQQKTKALNQLETVDFEQVLQAKFEFLHLLFEQEKAAFFKDKEAQAFIESNADWLRPYAAFCYLRDHNGTVKFPEWKEHSTFSPKVIDELCGPKSAVLDDIAFHYFLQYHAHRQLFGATEYARQHGVVLKGDLPIGIYRYSCDAWVAPHLYNMDGQAGAPPDPYSADGQNWGFPTYDWAVMAEDGFAWWRQRMTKLAEYFDALRIDHILGFFRIWEIPTNQVIGTMGLFNPRLPYAKHELAEMGLYGDLDRYTQPYIRGHFLPEMFGKEADFVRKEFLDEVAFGVFRLRKFVDNQLKIKELFANDKKYAARPQLVKPLMDLVGEVLLIEEPGSGGKRFNPRVMLRNSRSFRELGKQEQATIGRIHDDYFYSRHDEFWRGQAEWKLPALLQATNMFICGEDLGMIPKSVPGVMKALNIVALEIQRMAKGDALFGEPAEYPYMSVCSPSCHDMSTIRGWWEADYDMAQRFHEKFFDTRQPVSSGCTPGVVEAINQLHFDSPSMWAIFPIQDLVGMDAQLRRPDAKAEQINNPSITPHYWRFRFHLPLEKLMQAKGLNGKIKGMVEESGR